jgi:hypothetical protein
VFTLSSVHETRDRLEPVNTNPPETGECGGLPSGPQPARSPPLAGRSHAKGCVLPAENSVVPKPNAAPDLTPTMWLRLLLEDAIHWMDARALFRRIALSSVGVTPFCGSVAS